MAAGVFLRGGGRREPGTDQISHPLETRLDVFLVVRLDRKDRRGRMGLQEAEKSLELDRPPTQSRVGISGAVVVVQVHFNEVPPKGFKPPLHRNRGKNVEVARIEAEAEIRAADLVDEHLKRFGIVVEYVF